MQKPFRFSVSLHTSDLAVAHCLRGLSHLAQRTGRKMVAWGGTSEEAWKRAAGVLTFKFTDPAYRERFLADASRLLPTASWSERSRSDSFEQG